jgi:nucleoside-diphosphate-sugar epimerase
MRILITGGAGCLGSNLIEHWLPHGHDILVLDNFATGKREVVPAVAGLALREGDIADADWLEECFAAFRPEVVIHAAAAYKDPLDWTGDARTNVLGAINVARACSTHGVSRLVNFQTVLCYGRPRTLPIPADHPLAPFTSYGISKTAGEQYMLLSGLPTLSLRISNVTGPRLAIGPIPTFYKRLKAGQPCFCSDTARDFLDMADFVAFMDLAIAADAPTGTFNVASGEAHTILEVFEQVCAHLALGRPDIPVIPPADDDVPVVSLDTAATAAAFGWRARIGFEETIRRQLRWYDAHGVSDVYSHLKEPEHK